MNRLRVGLLFPDGTADVAEQLAAGDAELRVYRQRERDSAEVRCTA